MESKISHKFIYKTLTDIENRYAIAKGKGEAGDGWIGSLGLTDANYYI